MTQYEKLIDAVDRGIKILDDIGIKAGHITSYRIGNKTAKVWGRCKITNRVPTWEERTFEIMISQALLEDNAPDKSLMRVVLHELCHSAYGGMTHKGKWKDYANLVNKLTDYKITRTNSADDYGIKNPALEKAKYIIVCPKCGEYATYNKETKYVRLLKNNPTALRCRTCKCNTQKLVDRTKNEKYTLQVTLLF